MEYTKDELSAVMAAVARGNERTGGAEVIARGAGVVTFVQLAATQEEVWGVSIFVCVCVSVYHSSSRSASSLLSSSSAC